MVKEHHSSSSSTTRSDTVHIHTTKRVPVLAWFLLIVGIVCFGIAVFIGVATYQFEKTYENKIYPGVRVDAVSFGGKPAAEAEEYFRKKSEPFQELTIQLQHEQTIATLSGKTLAVAYDSKLSAMQAYMIGRSGHILADIYRKWKSATTGTNLTSIVTMNTAVLDDSLVSLATSIDIAPQDALFKFEKGKVLAFKPSVPGRKLDVSATKQKVLSAIHNSTTQAAPSKATVVIELPVYAQQPAETTEGSNDLGIKERLGRGTSTFFHSIPGRVHNVELGAKKIHGHLIAPGATFSFNDAIGDISAATGFAPAYIIKDGRTVLGDGGGVCQVSTTLFRAALSAGLPIEERHAHAYRVSYYEQDSGPGLDATVFAPSYDLKFKNDTGHHILIQTTIDTKNYALAFDIYGTSDGRRAEITKPVILSQTPPPEDLYQDDPTLPKGTVKQVDWKAWGSRVTFNYKVTRGNETLIQTSFASNFRPWQSVFLRGTKDS